jgi:hypothetical protein
MSLKIYSRDVDFYLTLADIEKHSNMAGTWGMYTVHKMFLHGKKMEKRKENFVCSVLTKKKIILFLQNLESCNRNMKNNPYFNVLRQFYDFKEFFKIIFLWCHMFIFLWKNESLAKSQSNWRRTLKPSYSCSSCQNILLNGFLLNSNTN